jgi:hypothetical protein
MRPTNSYILEEATKPRLSIKDSVDVLNADKVDVKVSFLDLFKNMNE